MARLTRIPDRYPLAFVLFITALFMFFASLSTTLGTIILSGEYGYYIGDTLGRLITIGIFFIILKRFGWLEGAGFRQVEERKAWLVILVPVLYISTISAYSFTGGFAYDLSDPIMAILIFLHMVIAALMEEIAFRGLILYSLLRWLGTSRIGIFRSVFLSSFLFGLMHMINFAGGHPMIMIFTLVFFGFFIGVFLGGVVVYGKSIWPAAVFHGVVNVALNLNLLNQPFHSMPIEIMMVLIGLTLPAGLYGLFLSRRAPLLEITPETE